MELWGVPWWAGLLAVVGAAAIVSAFLTLFFALNRPSRYTVTQRVPVDSDAFMQAITSAVNAPSMTGGSARLLNNGVEIFPAMLEAIRGARHSINFMVYIWEPGKVSDRMFDALTERARAGVEVRMMLDGFGAHSTPQDRIRELEEAGGRVRFFNPAKWGRLTAFYKRNHRRAIIVDGKVAFTGGAAVSDVWLGDAQDEDHWRDTMVEVRGCLATNLQSSFVQLWSGGTGEILVGEGFYPRDHDEPGADALTRHVHVTSTPVSVAHTLRVFFILTLACARERIWLTNSYFAPERNMRRTLAERARAGVDVRLLLPSKLTDARAVRYASHAFYRELLEAGVRIYEYQPTMMHSKTLVVDGVWSVVGSANMDNRSKELNQESVVGILDRSFGEQIERTFLDDLEQSTEIVLERWRRRSLMQRVKERFWVSFEQQF
jgi:cardiolipin synthase